MLEEKETIEKKKFGTEELMVKLSGRIDVTSTPEIEQEINSELDSISYLTIDMGDVNYISSVGLRALLSFQKKITPKGQMRIVNVKSEVLEIFKMVGFDKVLNIDID